MNPRSSLTKFSSFIPGIGRHKTQARNGTAVLSPHRTAGEAAPEPVVPLRRWGLASKPTQSRGSPRLARQAPGVGASLGPMAPVSKTLDAKARRLDQRMEQANVFKRMQSRYAAWDDLRGSLNLFRRDQRKLAASVNGLSIVAKDRGEDGKRPLEVKVQDISVRIQHADHLISQLDGALKQVDVCLERTPKRYAADRRWLRELRADLENHKQSLESARKHLSENSYMPAAQLNAYSAVLMPINDRTRELAYADDLPVGGRTASAVGEGKVHQVERLTYAITDAESGQVVQQDKVFKSEPMPEQGIPDALGAITGRLVGGSNLSGRAVASSRVDKLLQCKLVPDTGFAVHGDRFGVVMDWAPGTAPQSQGHARVEVDAQTAQWASSHPDELAGYAMRHGFSGARRVDGGNAIEFTREVKKYVLDKNGNPQGGPDGRPLFTTGPGDIEMVDLSLQNDPVYLREMCDASALGFLTNQADWHRGNYSIERAADGSVAALHFFDNDVAFGEVHDFSGKMINPTHLTALPPVMSASLCQRLLKITPEILRNELRGLVSETEAKAACERLAILQKHVEQLVADGRALDMPNEWTSPSTREALGLNQLERVGAATGAGDLMQVLNETGHNNMVVRDLVHMAAAVKCKELGMQDDAYTLAFDSQAIARDLKQLATVQ